MNRLISHIEFLLHEYNCVIVPDFGGFVVNAIHSGNEGGRIFHAPTCELVFNRDLTYNDGLMAQSYMKTYQLSFDSATLEIQNGVRELKHRLHDHRHVELGQLGTFTMHDEKRFVYKPEPFIRPAFFGLTTVALQPLDRMQPKEVVLNPDNKVRKIRTASISAAAVAAIAVLLLLLPMSDSTTRHHTAQMLSETEWFRSNKQVAQPPAMVEETNELKDTEGDVAPPVVDTPEVLVANSGPVYYVIMGVFSGSETARKMSDELQEKGFTDTGWLERSGRIDVYAASFTDEDAAKLCLREIHGKHPAYADAWILKR